MELPCQTDYVRIYFTLFEKFRQTGAVPPHRGPPFTYAEQVLLVFFTSMVMRRITTFKAQRRWLETHPAFQTTGAHRAGVGGFCRPLGGDAGSLL